MEFGAFVDADARLQLAALVYSPGHVARRFGQFALQVPRADFVFLARRAAACYGRHSAQSRQRFEERLNALLRERDEPPILWNEES
jgi:hypothetical protein